MISLSTDGDLRLAQVFQFEVSTLTVGQLLIFFKGNLLVQSVVVSTIVGDVQLTIATYYREVTTAVETAGMLCTYSDEVVMIDIIKCSCGISENGDRVGIALTVRGNVTTGKHSVADMYTTLFLVIGRLLFAHIEVLPSAIALVGRQGVQIFGRNIVVGIISVATKTNLSAILLNLKHR